MFRILLVDDNPADARLFGDLFKRSLDPLRLDWAKDGSEALEFLKRLGSDGSGTLPSLILMDINMPRMDGLEALRVIKDHPEWRVIPVVVLSTSAAPAEVRRAYEAGANGFVQKPASIERTERLVRAIEAFWVDFTVLPSLNDVRLGLSKGLPVAEERTEVRSQAMSVDESVTHGTSRSGSLRCDEHVRLMENFAATVKELLDLHEQQFQAIIQGDAECNRFDLLIHMANEKKQAAKYAYLRHVESHGCSNLNAITHSSGT